MERMKEMKQWWQEVVLEVEDAGPLYNNTNVCLYYYLVGFGTGALSSISLGILHPLYDPNLSIRVLLWFRWGFRTHLVVATWNDSCF